MDYVVKQPLSSYYKVNKCLWNFEGKCTIASKINVTPKGVRLSEKLQLTAALCNEI